MPVVTRVSGPSVNPEALPGARATAQLDPNFADPIVRGINSVGGAAIKIMEQEQEKADTAQLLEAQRKLGDWERSWFDPANTSGVYSHKGRDAVGLGDKINPDFDRVQSELSGNLKNPALRSKFQQWATGKREAVLDRVNGYSVREHEGYVAAEFDATIANQVDAAAAAGAEGRTDDQLREARQGFAAINAWAKMQGESPEVTARREDQFLDAMHGGVIDSLVASKQIDAAAKYFDAHDDELSPAALTKVKARLQPILDERAVDADIERIDAGQLPGVAGVSSDYATKRRRLEAADPSAVNALSGASGPDQFLASTWVEMIARHQPPWSEGKSKAEILAMRHDPQKSGEIAQIFDRENSTYLQRNGWPVTDHNLYLAHHFGASGAVKILAAPDGTPMKQLVSAAAYQANPYLQGKTKAQIIENHQRRGMTDGPAPEVQAWSGEPTLSDKLALAEATIADKDNLRKVKTGLRQREVERQSAKLANERLIGENIWNAAESVDPAASPEQVVSSAAGSDQLSRGDRAKYVEQIRTRLHQRLTNTFVQDDPQLVEDLNRQAALDPESFLKADIRGHFTKLSSPTLSSLLSRQAAMAKNPAKWAEARTTEQLLTSTFVDLGLTGQGKLKQRQELRDRFDLEERAFIEANNGRAPTEPEREVIMGRLLVWGARNVDRAPFIPGTTRETKRLYQIPDAQLVTNNPNGYDVAMSKDQSQRVVALLKRAGVPVTPANIRRVMLERGGKL